MTVRPVGVVTRGTTTRRRLRRADRWLIATQSSLLRRPGLLLIDLGFGERPVTTIELADRLRRINPTAHMLGLDISAERVGEAQPQTRPWLDFAVGGFELAGRRPHLVRAFNVLRQYDEETVVDAWWQMQGQLASDGVILDGTCDEAGRLGSWVTLDAEAPRSLTLALDPALEPSAVAARLPKALIHRNVPGEPVHRLLTDLDAEWHRHSGLGVFGARQRLAATAQGLRDRGWPLRDGPALWRRGLVTVLWRALGTTDH